MATYLAAKRPVENVILVTPFNSVTSLARAAFPWLPVVWILRHPFPSTAYAKSVDRPILTLVAAADEMIPTDHSESLFRAWKGQEHWQLLQGVGHNNIQMQPEYYAAIQAFVQGVH